MKFELELEGLVIKRGKYKGKNIVVFDLPRNSKKAFLVERRKTKGKGCSFAFNEV